MHDRRLGYRIPFETLVTSYVHDRPIRGLATNLSDTGLNMSTVTMVAPPPGAMIGLEIDLKKVLRSGKVILITAVVQIVGSLLFGLLVFKVAGFPLGGGQLDALYLALAVTFSSTVIIVKILYDKRELDTYTGRITLGVLVLQDVAAILFLALQNDLTDPAAAALAKEVQALEPVNIDPPLPDVSGSSRALQRLLPARRNAQ